MTQTRTKIRIARHLRTALLAKEERLRLLKSAAGIWKGKKGEAILREHKKIGREWEERMKKLDRIWKKKK